MTDTTADTSLDYVPQMKRRLFWGMVGAFIVHMSLFFGIVVVLSGMLHPVGLVSSIAAMIVTYWTAISIVRPITKYVYKYVQSYAQKVTPQLELPTYAPDQFWPDMYARRCKTMQFVSEQSADEFKSTYMAAQMRDLELIEDYMVEHGKGCWEMSVNSDSSAFKLVEPYATQYPNLPERIHTGLQQGESA